MWNSQEYEIREITEQFLVEKVTLDPLQSNKVGQWDGNQ